MTTDVAAQLGILADALTEIVDLATGGEKKVSAPPARSVGAGRGHRGRGPCRGRDLRTLAAVRAGRRDAGRRGGFRYAGVGVTAL